MLTHTENIDTENGNFELVRTASKTVRKFTQHFPGEDLPDSVCVNLDWLSFMCECTMPEPATDQGPVWLSKDIVIDPFGNGNKNFKYSYIVYMHGEPVANVHTHTRNEKIIKPGTGKLELLNHVLYSSTVTEVIKSVMDACQMPHIKNISGLHISMDGVKHIHRLCNMYQFQNRDRSGMPNVKKLGRWDKGCKIRLKGKARFDGKVMNKATGLNDNFKIGTGHKYVTVYNKTSELEHSHKEYIRDAWKKAEIDTTGTVWRAELRLGSQGVKEIKNFELDRIADPNYLLQIFKTLCKNFFEFALDEGDENVTRMRIIDIFQFEKLKTPLLEKIPRAIVRGAYKAKMAIHHVIQCVCLNYYKGEVAIVHAINNMTDTINMYNLTDWYEKRKPAWIEMYKAPGVVYQMGSGNVHL